MSFIDDDSETLPPKHGERVVGSMQEAIDMAREQLRVLDERAVQQHLYPDALNDGPADTGSAYSEEVDSFAAAFDEFESVLRRRLKFDKWAATFVSLFLAALLATALLSTR